MRRVRSRQRLVSWDQFDATVDLHPEGNDLLYKTNFSTITYDSDYMSCQSQSRQSSFLNCNTNEDENTNEDRNENPNLVSNSSLNHQSSLKNYFCESDNDNTFYCDTKDFTGVNMQSYAKADKSNDKSNINSSSNDRKTVKGTVKKQTNIVSPRSSPRSLRNIIRYPLLTESVPALDSNFDNEIAKQQHQKNGLAMRMMPSLNFDISLNPKKRNIDAIHKSSSFSTISSSSDIEEQNESQNFILDMHQDVQIHCFQFLDLFDMQALSLTCTHLHNLLAYGMEIHAPPSASRSMSILCNDNNDARRHSNAQEQIHDVMGVRNIVWFNIMQKRWPGLNLTTDLTQINIPSLPPLSPEQVRFVDHSSKRINYPALLSQSLIAPAAIDGKYFDERPAIPRFIFAHIDLPPIGDGDGQGTRGREQASFLSPPLFQTYRMDANIDIDGGAGTHTNNYVGSHTDTDIDTNTDHPDQSLTQIQVVQFVGQVGSGDQSIRADHPFPRPINHDAKEKKRGNGGIGKDIMKIMRRSTSNTSGMLRRIHEVPNTHEAPSSSPNETNHNFFHRLRGCKKFNHSVGAVIRSSQPMGINDNGNSNSNGPQPFVSPYITSIARHVEIDLTPRMMAYFEVSIIARDKVQACKSDVDRDNIGNIHRIRPTPNNEPPQFARRASRVGSSCVAVGLSKRGFPESSRMPGWDSFSYGYHGDDGGIFHARGDMIRVYGPTYNVGDTIGCGVNYLNGGIFYTLNGNFLGYAWVSEKDIQAAKTDLYPTVGVDSADPIACNFGNERPFMFNFPGFVANDGNMPIPMND